MTCEEANEEGGGERKIKMKTKNGVGGGKKRKIKRKEISSKESNKDR